MFNIRAYNKSDYKTISSWWRKADEVGPIEGMMIEDGTFVLEMNNIPTLSVTVFLTQSKEMAYIEGLVGNPDLKGRNRKEACKAIMEHAYQYAKERGYKRLIGFSYKDKLKKYYPTLGLVSTCKNLESFVKELS